MFKDLIKTIGIIIFCLNILFASLEANHEPQHLIDLRKLLDKVSYSHNGFINGGIQVSWANSNGASEYTCFTDSSGLLNALLSHTYGYTPENYHSWFGTYTPQSSDFFAAISHGNRFHQIRHVTDIDPGDIIAIDYPSGIIDDGSDTGHIAIVEKHPNYTTQKKPFIKGAQQWVIHVIDCAKVGHGIKDTRLIANGVYREGLGKGTMRLYIDQNGLIMGYTWSRLETEYFSQNVRPLVIGRLIP